MKIVYAAHPYRGETGTDEEIQKNLNNIDKICRNLIQNSDIILISPLHALSFLTYKDDQNMVIEKCKQLLSLCNELWVFGNWQTSEGCNKEIVHAKYLDIPIIFFDSEGRKIK